ncbi:MAG: class I SAM-dependent methyltransferase, partial [Patescibacteria group bacterium]
MSHWTNTYETHGRLIYEVDADVYQNQNLTNKEMDYVKMFLPTYPSPILDLACGIGRHAFAMADMSYMVIAVDKSLFFLSIALEKMKSRRYVEFHEGDARKLEFRSDFFPTVTILGNSFGYFRDAENEKILREVFRVLKVGGTLIFDVVDRERCLQKIIPYTHQSIETASFGIVSDERWKKWDSDRRTLCCRKRHSNDERVLLETDYEIRLYEGGEIQQILLSIGFGHVSMTKCEYESNLGLMSNRLMMVASK